MLMGVNATGGHVYIVIESEIRFETVLGLETGRSLTRGKLNNYGGPLEQANHKETFQLYVVVFRRGGER